MDPFIKLPRVQLFNGRQDFVLERCKGKRVLHIGCVDAGVLEQRYKAGQLMHQRMVEIADEVWGVDVDRDGLEFLRSKGFDKLLFQDAATIGDAPELQDQNFDLVVASELVEHLSNPGLFLDSVQKLLGDGKIELIISVPNAFRVDTLLYLFSGVEYVHPDHNYWFSYHTITTLLKKHNYKIEQVAMYSNQLSPVFQRTPNSSFLRFLVAVPKRLLVRLLYRITPFWGDGLIVVVTQIPPLEH
ncbi:MAG: class I SAM-dependent methyltransferase [Anaerolineae bacterium]|nr:class I SAM-dependent methyltransferase [Anaerolineae bacterium]